MSASRSPLPPPDTGGLSGDWKRLQDLRRQDRDGDREQDTDTSGDATGSGTPGATDDPDGSLPPRNRPRPGRSRGGRRPPPAAADAVPTTVRFDEEEAAEVDQFVLELRVQAHRRNLDKSEVIREVLRLAREHGPTRRALLKRLR